MADIGFNSSSNKKKKKKKKTRRVDTERALKRTTAANSVAQERLSRILEEMKKNNR